MGKRLIGPKQNGKATLVIIMEKFLVQMSQRFTGNAALNRRCLNAFRCGLWRSFPHLFGVAYSLLLLPELLDGKMASLSSSSFFSSSFSLRLFGYPPRTRLCSPLLLYVGLHQRSLFSAAFRACAFHRCSINFFSLTNFNYFKYY